MMIPHHEGAVMMAKDALKARPASGTQGYVGQDDQGPTEGDRARAEIAAGMVLGPRRI
jgi:hypothetical protein